jgi:hypothetical protein
MSGRDELPLVRFPVVVGPKLGGRQECMSRRAVGPCREAAIQNSPGLQPWVMYTADPP